MAAVRSRCEVIIAVALTLVLLALWLGLMHALIRLVNWAL
jgi:hypothetical protein